MWNKWSIDLFLWESEQKEELVPREGGWLRSLLQFAMLKSFLFVYGIGTQSQTHTLAERPLLIVTVSMVCSNTDRLFLTFHVGVLQQKHAS